MNKDKQKPAKEYKTMAIPEEPGDEAQHREYKTMAIPEEPGDAEKAQEKKKAKVFGDG